MPTADYGFAKALTTGPVPNEDQVNLDGAQTDSAYSESVTAEDDGAQYTDYKVSSYYEDDGHRYLMGVTSPMGYNGKSASVVQLALPTIVWVCRWTACRTGKHPKIPSPTTDDPNWVLLDDHYSPFMQTVLDDGTPLFRISGVYAYGYIGPETDPLTRVVYPRPPWLREFGDRQATTTDTEKGLITAAAPVAVKPFSTQYATR